MKEWSEESENLIFMHDKVNCHKEKAIGKFLAKNNVQVINWPGNSSAMNPIKNIWEFMTIGISKTVTTTKRDIIEVLIRIWDNSLIDENKNRKLYKEYAM